MMAIEWGPHTKAAADRLAEAIKAYNADGKHDKLIARAAAGEFTDFSSMHACPITELYKLCVKYDLKELADRVAEGEFDATKEESDEWANSPDGQRVANMLTPGMRAVFGMKPKE